ncbi:hypothetical protein [Kitasatospora brasiliensis]|uniref:hypothetical protein n=1 Tax=Kitasatospora brasiliensis TaxID=3058040 RepID=UPI002930D1B8|nr:hypothetical protein [Kitasatospora sp. K002]
MSEPSDAPGPTDAVPADATAPRGRLRSALAAGLPAVLVLVQIVVVAAGLSLVALGFSRYLDAYDASIAYRGAPACGVSVTTDCTRQETAKVTKMEAQRDADSPTYELTVSRETAAPAKYSVTEGLYDSVGIGTDIDLKFWNGHLVELSHQGHRSDVLSFPWLTALGLGCLVGAGTTLGLYGAFGRRIAHWAIPLAAFPVLAVLTLLGSVVLLATRWPLVLVVAFPTLVWLIATVIAAGFVWDEI